MNLKQACINLMKRGMTVGEIEGHARRMGMSELEAAKLKVKAIKWKEQQNINTNRPSSRLLS